MSILDQIQAAEAAQKSHRISPCTIVAKEEKPLRDDIIVLDPKLDPDPYGYHSIPLCDRLRAMGWP